MTYSVHQHWDPLRVCAVGRSYPPEFYHFIKNSQVRDIMQRIAYETEEDYQKLIQVLESFGVEVVRPIIDQDFSKYFNGVKYHAPTMQVPRDLTAMIGETFYMPSTRASNWDKIKGTDWPEIAPKTKEEFDQLPSWVLEELATSSKITSFEKLNSWRSVFHSFAPIEEKIQKQNNQIVYDTGVNTAMITRIGKDLYFGTDSYDQDRIQVKQQAETLFPDYRCHIINTGGHVDGTFCPVVPGLIVSLFDVPSYANTFPDWEVIYLPKQSWSAVRPFLDLKDKNKGKWWVPGEELNDDFTNFVENWLDHWVGYVEETVFDVNMLVIDEKNVICNNYNEKVFEAFSRYGITPHVVNFRHRYFWDGGLHCITSDLHREGVQKDYFPERRLT